MTKRKIILPVLVCLLAAVNIFAQEKPSNAPAKIRILFIGKNPDHPYGSHMYMHVSGVLAKCCELTPGVETVVSNGWPSDAKTLENVKCVVVYTNPGAELLLDNPHRVEFEKMMKSGVSLVTIHWASSIKKEDVDRLGDVWFSYTGATWLTNVGLSSGASPLTQLDKDHPICRGWQEFEINDEYYLNPTNKSAKPLLKVREKGGKDVEVAWTWQRPDGGRAFVTTLGHSYKYFQNDAFRRMIVNGVLWAAGVEVPKDGAPVNISAEALALPPKPEKK